MGKTIKSKTLNKQKNKLRGLISKARSTAFQKGLNLEPSYIYCRGLKEIYLDSRTKLLPHEFEPFLLWVQEQNQTVASDLSKSNALYVDLAGVISTGVSRSDLEDELIWVSTILKMNSVVINEFILFNEKLECFIISGLISEAISLIEEFESKHGTSFYTHENRIALENLNGGLEKQKEYVAEVRSKVKGGLLGFISYYTSIRNEDKTTITKFNEDLNTRLENHRYYDDSVKCYLKYKLSDELTYDLESFNDILFIEQSHHLFDLYNTYLDILQKISQSDNFSSLNKIITSCCNNLTDINDCRIRKIICSIEKSSPSLPTRSHEISDNLFVGNIRKALISWNKMPAKDKCDPWQFIYYSFALSSVKELRDRKLDLSPSSIPFLLREIILPSNINSKIYLDKIRKIHLNYSGLSFIKDIYVFAELMLRNIPIRKYNFKNIGLNCNFIGYENEPISNNPNPFTSSTSYAWNLIRGIDNGNFLNIPESIKQTLVAISMINAEDYESAINTITDLGRSNYRNLWSINLDLLLSSYFNISDVNNITRVIATEGVKEYKSYPLSYIQKFLSFDDWAKYKNVSDPILVCVAIHLLWKQNSNAETASMLRFAIRQCVRKNKVRRPSELLKLRRNTPLRVWKYFFREVCKNQFIDQLVQGSNELLLERQAICAHMSNIDYEFTDLYEDELADIAKSLAIDNGKRFIDRTRIHVDVDALGRWAEKELIEDYRRYHDLLDVKVKDSFENEFNEIFSELLKKGGNTTKWRSLNKDTEADMVFISLLAKLSDEFLNSSEYGLDFYLSKRVRHQSFIGLIRGPLEFDDLITTKESSGEYDKNQHVLSKLSDYSEDKINAIDKELRKFYKKFDDLLENTKNAYFQINGPDNPKGLIQLEIQEQAVFLLQMMTHKVTEFSDFVDIAIQVFWTSLSSSLSKVRQYISHNLKQSIVALFDELTINLKKIVPCQNIALHSLIHDIKNCSIKVQRQLDLAAQWFSRSGTDDIAQSTFDAEQIVDIAIDSTLKCHQSFHPKIHKSILNEDGLLLDTTALMFAHDVMFVALGNVCRHSGVKEPNIAIETKVKEKSYSINVKSDFSSKNSKNTHEKLDEIRKLIDERKFERRTRKEGGSGLLKIAAAALQDPLGSIDFGVIDDSFTLNVTSRLFMTSISVEDIHG
ncbi:hypothetical protein ACM6XL_001281 [Vibrio vulnificus]|uniref:hypothetical protein n=1 Tax=Vibrio vulnificus TaxID=672 RepID=UPI000C7C6A0D|nr:hypothetical protein [Vibrio vulnificus]AUL95101.1 hypothetical protein FORC54_0956 [Vibrio vulnificus]PNG76189.1 hypothetical protein TI06_11520 [Vibrio vulnificus]HAS8339516.1 hypothetical protein [Vibrio vulnificus]